MMKSLSFLAIPVVALALAAILVSAGFAQGPRQSADVTSIPDNPDLVNIMPENLPKATFAGGCFWCLESEFRNKSGVVFTRSGYIGGTADNPTYDMVTTGKTGHAEAVEIYYDPAKTDFKTLLDHFLLNAHDPTTRNQQWVDKGTQYRSAIFYHDEEQRKIAEETIARIDVEKIYSSPIVTELVQAPVFWPAEDYHQQYYEKYEQERGQPHLRVILKNELKKKKN